MLVTLSPRDGFDREIANKVTTTVALQKQIDVLLKLVEMFQNEQLFPNQL